MFVYIDTCVYRDIVDKRRNHDTAVELMNYCVETNTVIVSSSFQETQLADQNLIRTLKDRYCDQVRANCAASSTDVQQEAKLLADRHGLDWEDTVHFLLAERNDCSYFITANIQDYRDIHRVTNTSVDIDKPVIAKAWWADHQL